MSRFACANRVWLPAGCEKSGQSGAEAVGLLCSALSSHHNTTLATKQNSTTRLIPVRFLSGRNSSIADRDAAGRASTRAVCVLNGPCFAKGARTLISARLIRTLQTPTSRCRHPPSRHSIRQPRYLRSMLRSSTLSAITTTYIIRMGVHAYEAVPGASTPGDYEEIELRGARAAGESRCVLSREKTRRKTGRRQRKPCRMRLTNSRLNLQRWLRR